MGMITVPMNDGDNQCVIGNAVLWNEDYFEIVTENKPDHIITDPPYSNRTHKGALTNKRTAPDSVEGRHHEPEKLIDFDHWDMDAFDTFLMVCMDSVKRWTVMTCDHHHAAYALMAYPKQVIRLGAWVKNNPMPQVSGDRPSQGHEAVLILHGEGKKRWNGGGRPAIWKTNVHNQNRLMPTQKPLSLIRQFIEDFTDKGETIMDPCMGSGTVGVACLERARNFIGIEIDRGRYELARERIDLQARQGSLFE